MKQQNHPHDIRTTNAGVEQDIDQELQGSLPGVVVDRHNMRTASMDGSNGASKKINGEEVLYPNIDNRCNGGTGLPLSTSYECVGVAEINGYIVEFWADADGLDSSLVRIDGLIVLQSEDFPLQSDFPLQIAKNESCVGGEVYFTDFNSPPMFLNIKDLLLNSGVSVDGEAGSCGEKYFSEFDLSQYLLVLGRTVEHPVFIKLDTGGAYDFTFGASGLPVGYVTYSHRYVTLTGERTGWSAPTPQIPIIKRVSSSCAPYPNSKAISKNPDISVPSIYGAHIRIRLDNENDYDSVQVRRDSWIAGDPLGTPATSEVAGRIQLLPGQFGIVDILDKGGSEEVLSNTDTTNVMTAISRAKAIRYFNNRLYLMNIEYASRDVEDTVTMIDEGLSTVIFPAIRKINKDGHSDPHKAAYHKSTMRGEKHGYGIVLYDGQGQNTFAKSIGGAENFQMPQRRDITSSLTEGVSYYGTVRAAHTDGTTGFNNGVGQTHEVFDLVDAVQKTNACLYANIMDNGTRDTNAIDYVTDPDFGDCEPTTSDWNAGLGLTSMNKMGYKPWAPVNQDDQDCSHLDFRYNIAVGKTSNFSVPYNPKGYEPNYYSAGVAFKGVESLPVWAKAFSIVKTPPADKVVAQGLGYYSLIGADGDLGDNTSKKLNEIAVYLPDLDAEIGLNPTLIEDIKSDPAAFAVQVVSPLGFFTEVATFIDSTEALLPERDRGVDMLTFARIIEDSSQKINPNENVDMGVGDPASGTNNRYTAFGKWRATNFETTGRFANTGDASGVLAQFDIDSPGPIDYVSQSGRSNYFRIPLVENLWTTGTTSGSVNTDDTDVQRWHEPLYVINIIRKAADVPVTNSTNFDSTGHYQKLSSTIGVSDGTESQSFELVDERWEDVLQNPNGEIQNDYSSLYRFVFIKDILGNEKRWLNWDNITGAPLTAIILDISNNGFANVTDASGTYQVYGIYKSSETTDYTAKIFSVNFAWSFMGYDKDIFIPLEGSEVIVKYDNRIPIRVFGGDTWINESIWAIKDKQYGNNGKNIAEGDRDQGDGQGDFRLSIPFPFKRFQLNPRQIVVRNTKGLQRQQITEWYKVTGGIATGNSSLRQLINVWTAESRINLSFAFNDESLLSNHEQYFPLKNYVQRPHKYDNGLFGTDAATVYADNGIFAAYEDDYGDEFKNWIYGGFRFLPQVNIDYSKADNTRAFASVPAIGYDEQNKFCTRIIWSALKAINVQDSPGIRTFYTINSYDISDDTGEIKRAYDAISEKGNNLYAFTEEGVCLLLIDKRIIHEINANELATVGSDVGGILNELWINKDIGMSEEMWRSVGEYSNFILWMNKNSVYLMASNQITDIARKGYHSYIRKFFLDKLGTGYIDKVTGVYDILHNEYWCNINLYNEDPLKVTKRPTLVFNQGSQQWEGTNDYNFDKFLSFDNTTYGMREMETYILNEGRIISGEQVNAFLTQACSVMKSTTGRNSVDISDKEFIRIRVNSDNKPTKVEFFNDLQGLLIGDVKCELDTIANPLALKDYNGFEQYIPRQTISRDRMQGRLLIFKISHNLDEDFKIITTDIQYKQLK